MNQRCLFCKGKNTIPSGNRDWLCTDCRVTFNAEDDGEVYTDPTKRLRMHEQQHTRHRAFGHRR